MTLLISMLGCDGYVVAYDLRGSGTHSYDDWTFKHEAATDRITVFFAGDSRFATHIINGATRTYRGHPSDVAAYADVLREIAVKRFQAFGPGTAWRLHPQAEEHAVQFLVVGYDDRPEAIPRQPTVILLDWDNCFAGGEPTLTPLALGVPDVAKYYMNLLYVPSMTTDTLCLLASFLLFATSGATHLVSQLKWQLVVLTPDGKLRHVERTRDGAPDYLTKAILAHGEMKDALQRVFPFK